MERLNNDTSNAWNTTLPTSVSTLQDKVSGNSIKLLALVETSKDGWSIFRFRKSVEDINEIPDLIDALKWNEIKDIIVRLENGFIVNNNPEATLWEDTFIFSDEATPVIMGLLGCPKPGTETKIITNEGSGVCITQEEIAA